MPANDSVPRPQRIAIGLGLGAYRYTRFRAPPPCRHGCILPALDAETSAVLAACTRVRDLINTPTEHLGPEQLEQIARDIATAHGAEFTSIVGEDLLAQNFPAIHAVGRASHRAPRLLHLQWGDAAHPHVVIVGKGVARHGGWPQARRRHAQHEEGLGGAAHALRWSNW